MVWDLGEACATGTSFAPSMCKVTFQNISLVPYKSMITMITMGEVKINRCWSKFVVLFIKACYFCFRNFQCSTRSENGVGCHQGYFRICRWTETKENWQTFASVTAASLVVSILNQCSIFEDWSHYKGKQINFY